MNNGKIETFTDLNAWKEAHILVLSIYKTTRIFPREETYSLTDQMRRAAVSIVSNIAEGFSRESYKEKVQFYAISRGSNTELQSQLLIAKDLGYMPILEFTQLNQQAIIVHKLITGLIKASKLRIMNNGRRIMNNATQL